MTKAKARTKAKAKVGSPHFPSPEVIKRLCKTLVKDSPTVTTIEVEVGLEPGYRGYLVNGRYACARIVTMLREELNGHKREDHVGLYDIPPSALAQVIEALDNGDVQYWLYEYVYDVANHFMSRPDKCAIVCRCVDLDPENVGVVDLLNLIQIWGVLSANKHVREWTRRGDDY